MGARPHTLRCSKCKKGRDWEHSETRSCTNLVATGGVKIARRYHGRYDVTLWEIKHTTCGTVMWSCHHDAKWLYERRDAT